VGRLLSLLFQLGCGWRWCACGSYRLAIGGWFQLLVCVHINLFGGHRLGIQLRQGQNQWRLTRQQHRRDVRCQLLDVTEGQQVRLGQSVLRPDIRLALLDEAFRGLDRPQRQALLVMEQGRIVEDAPPAQLLAQVSRYRALLEAERSVREELWADAEWRRLWLEDGELKEHSRTDDRPDNRD